MHYCLSSPKPSRLSQTLAARTYVDAPWLASTTSNEERHVGQAPSCVRPLGAALLSRGPVLFS